MQQKKKLKIIFVLMYWINWNKKRVFGTYQIRRSSLTSSLRQYSANKAIN